jgi:hypothetical protein
LSVVLAFVNSVHLRADVTAVLWSEVHSHVCFEFRMVT